MNLPQSVQIIEVGPRDGFQNIETFIPTSVKLEVIDVLVSAGFKKIQTTSFVHPKAIPQMRDAAEIARKVTETYKDVAFSALVPNFHGAKAAREAGIREISCVISASESHNKANIRRTIDESFQELEKIREAFGDLTVKLDMATAFGCPFEKEVPVGQVTAMMERAYALGVDQVFLCDTIGVANPAQMERVLTAVGKSFPDKTVGLHLHDTRGMGLANALVAVQNGFTVFETAVGGLGGCPFAPGAAGNTASEDLVNMMETMGVATGIDMERLIVAANLIRKTIKPELTSHMANVCQA